MERALWYPRPLHRHPLGAGHEVLTAAGGGRVVLTCRQAEAVARCGALAGAFCSLQEQAARAADAIGLDAGERRRLPELLAELAQRGFFVSESDLLARAAAERVPAPIRGFGIVTGGRAQSLARTVRSFQANARTHGHAPEFLVLGDSADERVQREQSATLASLRAEGVPVRFAGLDQKRAYAGRLARSAGVDPALVELALLGVAGCPGIGANRNGLLLESAGTALVSVDDDVLCELAEAGRTAGLLCTDEPNPVRVQPHPDGASLERALRPVRRDFLDTHARYLGHSVAAVLAARDVEPRLLPAGCASIVEAAARRTGIVAMTWAGLHGDAGSDSPAPYLVLPDPELAALVADERTYRAACTHRLAWKGVRQVTLGTSRFCQSAAIGLANQQLLPPFMPLWRASDASFGEAIRLVLEDSATVFLPESVKHYPPERRRWAPDAMWEWARGPWFQQLHGLVLAAFVPSPGRALPEERLADLGRHFRHLGALPPSDLDEFFVAAGLPALTRLCQALEQRLQQRAGQPKFWADDVRRSLDQLRAAVGTPGYMIPRELRAEAEPEQAWSRLRWLLVRFGALLEAWPTLVQSARRLREEGQGLMEELPP